MTETVVQRAPTVLPTLEVEIRNEHNRVVLALRGEADHATASRLSRALSSAADGSVYRTTDARGCDVVVDVADLEFIDCRCLGIIVEARRDLREQRRGLRLRSPSRFLRRVLRILDLESLVEARTSTASEPLVTTGDQYVVDFYRSLDGPFFGAVVSRPRRPALSDLDRWTGARSSPTLVTMVGELNASTAPILRTCLDRIDDDLVVDCSGLDEVDARGLQILRDARARWARTPAEFVVVDPPDSLLWLSGIAGLDGNVNARARSRSEKEAG